MLVKKFLDLIFVALYSFLEFVFLKKLLCLVGNIFLFDQHYCLRRNLGLFRRPDSRSEIGGLIDMLKLLLTFFPLFPDPVVPVLFCLFTLQIS